MPSVTPKYGIKTPSETTRLNQLGQELREMGASIETVLSSFDYNGTDPELIRVRLSNAESDITAIKGRLNALESAAALIPTEQHGLGTSLSVPAGGATAVQTVTFPKAYKATPGLSLTTYGDVRDGSVMLLSVSRTGFTYKLGSNSTAARTFQASWLAIGVLA